jgi:hypothetical protein
MAYPFPIETDTLGGIWSRNDQHSTWADLEDAFYTELTEPTAVVILHLIDQLGLGAPEGPVAFDATGAYVPAGASVAKSITMDLQKGAQDVDRMRYLPKSVIRYLRDGKSWSNEQLTEIERLLRKGLAKNATLADRYVIKAEALSALMQAFDRAGRKLPAIFLPDLPVTLNARKNLPAPHPGKEYRLRADKGAPDQPVLPLTTLEEEAIRWAQLHAGEKIATQNQYIISTTRELVIQARRGRWTPGELQKALLDKLGEFNRDWRRIAITELAECMANGYLATLPVGTFVIGQADGTACEWCKAHIHGKIFKVVKEPGDPWREVWVGKTNYGRRKKDWVPCIPGHPNCRCRWQVFDPKFMKVTPEGRIDLKTPEEILTERQALRATLKSIFDGPDVLIKGHGAPDFDRLADLSQYEWRDPHTLGANPNQVPMLNPEKLAKVRERFSREGIYKPILIDAHGTILDGHHLWYVAMEAGGFWVPVIVAPLRVSQAVDEAGENDDTGAIAQEAMGVGE